MVILNSLTPYSTPRYSTRSYYPSRLIFVSPIVAVASPFLLTCPNYFNLLSVILVRATILSYSFSLVIALPSHITRRLFSISLQASLVPLFSLNTRHCNRYISAGQRPLNYLMESIVSTVSLSLSHLEY